MNDPHLTDRDLEQIAGENLDAAAIQGQLQKFIRGTTPVNLVRPCTPEDGIECPSPEVRLHWINTYDTLADTLKVVKFIPASGAATRMFKTWFSLLQGEEEDSANILRQTGDAIKRYPFVHDLEEKIREEGATIDQWRQNGEIKKILETILLAEGLNYGDAPKALIKFHQYDDTARTALEEHLAEAAGYGRSQGNISRIHITVSPEFLDRVKRHLQEIMPEYEQRYGISYEVEFSVQKTSTNTIAVDPDNRPFRDEEGKLLFRPGGHGALLENLAQIDGDLIFIKNIDNVSREEMQDVNQSAKKMLAGLFLIIRQHLFSSLTLLASGNVTDDQLREMYEYCRQSLHLDLPAGFLSLPRKEQREILFTAMNRPIRVCGMVRNTGEPGGGPFWVRDEKGRLSLQIIEQFQVNTVDPNQLAIWSSSTHFNPVDLVCGIKDFRGNPFNLKDFADQDAVCITVKSEKGRSLKALELPGLWNGSMARWISVFVDVPMETFTPVKVVEDLLRGEHRPPSVK